MWVLYSWSRRGHGVCLWRSADFHIGRICRVIFAMNGRLRDTMNGINAQESEDYKSDLPNKEIV